uniref:Putative pteridine transporter FT2 n=1 Tax=Leishmania donovani TaxID=5661 RepID=Q9UAC1_LEIDO|nr:putative pteridine transporter FT2 [Leishmania donovani]
MAKGQCEGQASPEEMSADPYRNDAAVKPERFVHPEAAALFSKWPWVRRVPMFGEAVEGYGLKVIVALGATNLLCRGVADRILTGQTYAMMIDRYGIDVARYQRLSTIATMGWSIKAFTAMLCDGFAFLGYTKRWYMFISCVGGGAFALIYGLLPAKEASADVAAAFIFLSTWGKANVDILSEGHYSRLMRQNPKPGPSMVSWIWFWIMVGAIIATVMNGPLADAGKPQISIFVSAALQLITCVFYLFNWYGEKKNRVLRSEDALFILEETRKERDRFRLPAHDEPVTGVPQHGGAAKGKRSPQRSHSDEDVEGAVRDALNDGQRDNGELVQDVYDDAYDDGEEVAEGEVYYGKPPVPCLFGLFEANTEVISKNWKIFVYSVVMTCAVIAMLCCNILADTLGLLIACVVVSTICCATSFWALPLVIAKANVFCYLQMAVYIRATSPLYAFYLNSNECQGDYPNFTYTFYNTVAGVIGNLAGLVGVTLFNFLFAKHNYQVTFIVTTIMQVLAALFDIIMVKRWNKRIGIPDHAMYIWGDAVVAQIVYMLGFMPLVVMLSRLCPRGSESVVYALMAGFANLGQTTSSSLAAIIMEYGWPIFSDNDPCNYDNLPLLLFVTSVCTPLLVIPLSYLLPMARIIDDVDIDGKVVRQKADEMRAKVMAAAKDSTLEHSAEASAAAAAPKGHL